MIGPKDLILEEKDNRLSVIFHKVLSFIGNTNTKRFLCFFEGAEDLSYYCRFIGCEISKYEPFCCNGKEKVVKLYFLLKGKNLKNCKTAYFIDKDFDSSLSCNEIFETDCYSIENYFCNQLFITNLLKNEFMLNSDDSEFIKCIKLFQEKQQEFHESIILFNAWYFNFKKNIALKKGNLNVFLEKKIYDGFINWQFDQQITSNYTLETIYNRFPEVPIVSKDEILNIISSLKKKKLSQVLRGKYELEFIQYFIRYLIDDGNQKEKRKYLSKKTTVNFQEDRFITTFCQYAQEPSNLKNYISARFHLTKS